MSECTGCMKCQEVCPLTPFGLGIGIIVKYCLAGREDDLIDSSEIWQCAMCFACDDSCPESLNPREVMMSLRRRFQNYPDAYRKLIRNIRRSGCAFPTKKEKIEDYPELLGLA